MCDKVKSLAALEAGTLENNRKLVASLREDDLAPELLEATQKDIRLGRMGALQEYDEAQCAGTLLHPRFGVSQQKEDGSVKVRPVDNFSWSAWGGSKKEAKEESVNGHVHPTEKLRHDTLDMLALVLVFFVQTVGSIPGLLKASLGCA